jgi:hypothetical protein
MLTSHARPARRPWLVVFPSLSFQMIVPRACIATLGVAALSVAAAGAQAPAPGGVPAQTAAQGPPSTTVTAGPATPAPGVRVFASPAGLLLNAIRADAVADFERVLGRLAEALAASPDPVRQRQAAGWRVFRATEPGPADSVLFVFVMDPVVPGADYGVARVLAEAFPDEAGALYALYSGAYAPGGQTMLNLEAVDAFDLSPGLPAPR